MPRLKHFTFSFLFFSQIFCLASDTQNAQKSVERELKNLIEVGNQAIIAGEYPKALQYLTKAEIIAEGKNLDGYELVIKFTIGRVYSEIYSLGDALKYYNDALSIANTNPKFNENGIAILIDIGVLYFHNKDYSSGLEYYLKSYAKAKSVNSIRNIVTSAINISDVYNRLGKYDLSRKYLDEIENFKMDNLSAQTWKINYAESYFKEGRLKDAEAIMQKVWGNVDNTNENHCFVCVVKLLSQISNSRGNISEAIAYAKHGLKNARSIQDRAEMYTLLSDTYYNDKQYQNAYIYKDLLLNANDSMSKKAQTSLYAINKIKLKINDYQSEAHYNEEKRVAQRNFFILVIALGLILFYFIYRSLRNNIIRQKQENTIADNKQKIYELELNKLTGDIAEKNRKLSAKALYLSGRNALIEEVINSLDQISEIQQTNVHNHIKDLRGHLRADKDWDDFTSNFEQVNPNFLKLLQSRHPQLNAADVRFICHLYMNLELKEISSILNITIEAARKRKQRIAKKMDLDVEDLNRYIITFC